MTWALLAGIVAGLIHVLSGPDHVMAVTPFAMEERRSSWRTGLWWGVGHTGGVWVIALFAFLFRRMLPIESLSQWSETLVGVTLIVIGIWGLHRALRYRIHQHEHTHDRVVHSHFHVHQDAGEPHDHRSHRHAHAPLLIGVLHGVAGSAHVLGIIPALLLPSRVDGGAYVVGFGVGSIAAMVGFAWVMGRFARRWRTRYARTYGAVQAVIALAAITLGIVWLGG